MAFSGGVYTLPGPALASGEIVSSSENNQFRNDVATAFNLTFLRNGTSTATANLPMGGYKLTGLGVATTSGDALSYAQAATVSTLTATGAAALNGGITVDSTAFTVADTTGNTSIAGTLAVTGATTLTGALAANGGIAVDTSAFTVADTTGNTSIAGTLAVTGVTTLTANPVLSGGTANGVAYLNGSKVLTSGSALTFDGTNLGVNSPILAARTLSVKGRAAFTASANDSQLAIYSDGVTNGLYSTYNSTGSYLPMTFYINDAEQMRLTSTGLGIGTSSPAYKVDAVGSIQAQGNHGAGSFNAFIIKNALNSAGSGKISWQGSNSNETWAIAQNQTVGAGYLEFNYLGSNKAVFDSSGNLGLGVTPSAWISAFKAFEIHTAGSISSISDELGINANSYYATGTNWTYKSNGYASQYRQNLGQHRWYTAPSGTAGNAISFTQAMTLDASGKLFIGETTVAGSAVKLGLVGTALFGKADPAYVLDVNDNLTLYSASGSPTQFRTWIGGTASALYGHKPGDANLYITNTYYGNTLGSNGIAIDSSGNVGIGTSSPSQRLHVYKASYPILYIADATYSSDLGIDSGSGNFVLGNNSSAATIIKTGGSERMRIDSSGNLLINTTSGSYKLTLNGQPGANGYTAWTNYSDARLKENVTDFTTETVLDKVCSLRPVTFNYNDKTGFDEETRQRRISGFIAQELQQVFPDMVGAVEINGDEYLDTNLSNLTLYLLQAVKELSAKVAALEAK